MKLNRLLSINAAFALISALGFILAPAQMLWHLAPLGAAGEWVARELGGSVMGYAVLAWLARNLADTPARRVIVRGLFVSWVVGFAIAFLRQLSGVAAPAAWGAVVIYLAFAIGYGTVLIAPGANETT